MTNFKRFFCDKFYDYYDKKSLNLNYDIFKQVTHKYVYN